MVFFITSFFLLGDAARLRLGQPESKLTFGISAV